MRTLCLAKIQMRCEKLCCRFLGECKFVWLCNRYMRAVMNLKCNEVLQHFWLSHSCISTLVTLTSALFSAIFIFKMIFLRASSSVGSLAKASLPSKLMPFICYLSFSSSFLVWVFVFPAWFFCFSFRFCWASQHFRESLPSTDGFVAETQYVW